MLIPSAVCCPQGLDDGLRAKRKAAIMELEAVASLLLPQGGS
jgi:hypothetical protein